MLPQPTVLQRATMPVWISTAFLWRFHFRAFQLKCASKYLNYFPFQCLINPQRQGSNKSLFLSFSRSLQSRRPSVSFTAMPPGVLVNDSHSNSTDDIQIALAPHIQTYLSQTGRRHSCCSVMLPVAFERASSKSWMDPKFDSPVLEGQFQTSVFPHVRMRYRWVIELSRVSDAD